MTTVLVVRPADGGGPARRAMLRWAWRMFREEWRQQVLVLALIIVAVTATILAAGIGTNTPPPANAGFGTANHLVALPGTDRRLAADIAAIKAHFGVVDVIETESLATGLAQGAQLRAQDPAGSFGRPMLALRSGRYPSGVGEVAMTRQLASTFGVHVGDLWHRGSGTQRVVGIVENPQNLLDNFALVAPGQLTSPTTATVLFDATKPGVATFTFPDGAAPVTPRPSTGISPAVVVLVFSAFGLIFIGLVAAAGFTVLAQRRLHSLAMVSSVGATDRNVRLVLVANGAVVGTVGALLGALIGLTAWIAYAPRLTTSAHHRIAWTHLPWWLIVTAVALAIATAILAARRPARSVTQVPIVAALSGRPAAPKAVHRSALPGAALLAAGLALLAFSGGWGARGANHLLYLLGGVVGVAAGLMFLAPLCVSLLAVIGGRTPVATRIALRDLARYPARSGPAIAATSLAILIAVLTSLVATGRYADALDYFGPNLPSNQVVVYAPEPAVPLGKPGPNLGNPIPLQTPAELQAHANAIAVLLGSQNVLALEATTAILGQETSQQNGIRGAQGQMYLATPALLHRYGINPSAIDPTTMVITSRRGLAGTSNLRLLNGNPLAQDQAPPMLRNPKIQTFKQLPTDTSDPNLLITTYAVRTLKLDVTPAAWLIQTPRAVHAAQINAARQTAAAAGLTIETRNGNQSLDQLRNYATAAGILLALGVLAMTVGLIRSETAGDLRTLTATGASSRTRRNITGATAGAIGILAAVLGTAVAYLATTAFFRSQLTQRMSRAPVLDLVLVLVGLPVVAAAGGWLFAGREPAAIAHQPLA